MDRLIPDQDSYVKVEIIMIVHNQWASTIKAIHALQKNTPQTLAWKLTIIRNTRTNKATTELQREPGALTAFYNTVRSYLYIAWNKGAAISSAEFLVFIDDSIEVQPGWLEALHAELEAHPEIGVAGGKIIQRDGSVLNTGLAIGRNLTPVHINHGIKPDDLLANERRVCVAVDPCCFVVRRNEFLDLGLFDEELSMLAGLDLCLRYRRTGQKSAYCPECTVLQTEDAVRHNNNLEPNELFKLLYKNIDQLIQNDFYYMTKAPSANIKKRILNFAINICTP